jgi:large subunit ribosomal protein L4
MEIDIINNEGKAKGKAKLPETLAAAGKLNPHLVHEVVKAYLANQRLGTHSTLTRSEVTGGGKKPWKQKHTGRARQGSIRSPLFRKGGIIGGPKPRDYRENIPQAKVKNALLQILASKAASGAMVVSEAPQLAAPKTKLVSQWLKAMSAGNKSLLVLDKKDAKLAQASRNLPNFAWIECKHLHPVHVLGVKKIIFTPEAVKCL